MLIFSISAFSQCPIYGDRSEPRFRMLDSLKNRNSVGTFDMSVTLNRILTNTMDDRADYTSSQYVKLQGYVVLVKYGDKETCNCHSTNKDDWDIHIELALNPNAKGTESMIVEINRFTRKAHPEFSVENLKKLKGQLVEVEGFLFFDEEHWQNSVTINPSGKNNWRHTCWEVHPTMNIKKI